MPRSFAITTTTNTVRLDAQGRGEATFTVSNTTDDNVRGRAQLVAVKPQDGAGTPVPEDWLALEGEATHTFAPNDTRQHTVSISVPSGAAAGSYGFRLDMVGVENPDEDYTGGPTVAFRVPEPEKKTFPWWIVVVVAAVLLIAGGITTYLLTRQPPPPPTVPPIITVVPISPTPSPTPTPILEPPVITLQPVSPQTGLEALRLADGSVRFTWNDAQGEVAYRYEIAVVGGSLGAARTDTLPADTTVFDGGDLNCGDRVTFTLVSIAEDGSEIGSTETSLEVPACPPQTVALEPVQAMSGDLSAAGCAKYPPIRTGIAPAGNGIRGVATFDISGLQNQAAILEATLDLSNYRGDPFEFIQPLYIAQTTFTDPCSYPDTYTASAATELVGISAAIPGLTTPIDVTAAVADAAAAGEDTFQIELYFDHDDAGQAFAGLVEWSSMNLTVRYQP